MKNALVDTESHGSAPGTRANRLKSFITSLFVVSIFASPAFAIDLPPTPRADAWITDGVVSAIVRTSDTVYLSGSFQHVGPPTSQGVAIDAANGQVLPEFPQVNGRVYDSIPDGSGGWYIGGAFTSVGGVARNNLARILADGSVAPWNPNVAGTAVLTMHSADSLLFIGGFFTLVGGQARDCLAAVDLTTGIPTSWSPDLTGPFGDSPFVYDILVSDSTVYICGFFSQVGGVTRNSLAAVDSTTGNPTSWFPQVESGFGVAVVRKMVIFGSTLYFGGNFFTVNDQDRVNLAAVDVATGDLTSWNPSPTGGFTSQILTLELSGNVLYVGGEFTSIAGQSRNYLAAFDITTGNLSAWAPQPNSPVFEISVDGDTIYIGGLFTTVAGESRRHLAALDAATGAPTPFQSIVFGLTPYSFRYYSPLISSITPVGSALFVGGEFHSIGGSRRENLAALDAATGIATPWNPGASFLVSAMALSGSTLYVAGSLDQVGGQPRDHLAAVDTITGLVTPWSPDVNSPVDAIAISGSTVYAGGSFTAVDGQTRRGIAAIDAATGDLLPWDAAANTGASVASIIPAGSILYVGGSFSSIGGQPRNCIAALDTTTATASAWNPNANGGVYALALHNSLIYVGGNFSNIGGASRPGTAALDIATGAATSWVPAGHSFHFGTVSSIAVADSAVILAGTFETLTNPLRRFLAAYDATTGVSVWDPQSDDVVHTVIASNNALHVGGFFSRMALNDRPSYAQFEFPRTVAFQTDGTPGASITGENPQSVHYGANASAVTANAPAPYFFVNWTHNGAPYSTDNPLTVTNVTESLTLVANFGFDASLLWVDFNYNGPEYGIEAFPFNTLLEAVTFADPNALINIKPGTTPETLRITKPLTLEAPQGPVRIGN